MKVDPTLLLAALPPTPRFGSPNRGVLLRAGVLGSGPPLMARFEPGGDWFRDGFNRDDLSEVVELGLPLWWNGALVPEGWFRAWSLAREAGMTSWRPSEMRALRRLPPKVDRETLVVLGKLLVRKGVSGGLWEHVAEWRRLA